MTWTLLGVAIATLCATVLRGRCDPRWRARRMMQRQRRRWELPR